MMRRWMELPGGRRLGGILALGLLVRLLNLGGRGLQYDDVFSIFLSARSLPEIVRGTAADTMPPLYYFILHFWGLVSQADWYLRLPGVLFSLAAIYLGFRWVLEVTGSRYGAEWAAFLMAISPFQYYHAQDVRNYALLLCAQLGYLLFFARIWRRDAQGQQTRRLDWAGLVFCGAAALYTHNVAGLALVLPNLWVLLRRRWGLLGRLLAAQALIGLCAAPWLAYLPGQLAKVQSAWWLWRPGLIDVLQTPVVWSAGLPLPGWKLAAGLILGIEILALLGIEAWKNRGEAAVFVFGLTALVLPAIFFGLSYVVRPIFVPRGFILAGAAYLCLAGWAIERGWRKGPGKLLAGGFVLAALLGIPAQATFNDFPRSPFERAAAGLQADILPGEIVVHENKLSAFPMLYYQPELPQTFIQDEAGGANDNFARGSQEAMQIYPAADIAGGVGGHSGVYFVTFSQTAAEYQALGYARSPNLDWLETHFRLEGKAVENDLEIYHYVQP